MAYYGALYHGCRTLRDPNSSSHTGDKLNTHSGAPEGNIQHTVPVERNFVTLCAYVHFAQALQVDMLERLSRKCQLRDVTGNLGSVLSEV